MHRMESFVRVAFRLVFWELLHTLSPHEAMLDSVNRGGCTNVHGALGGALAGARETAQELPAGWLETVRLALELPWKEGREGDPKALLALVAAVSK